MAATVPASFVSIVIPTYNRRELTLRAVQSVLDQEHAGALEVIVVDDGSSDGTADAIIETFRHGQRVRLLRSERRYACGARNLGFASAKGDFVCFLDSDDFWLPGTLAVFQLVFAQVPELAFVSIEGSTNATSGQAAIARIVAAGSPGWTHARFKQAPLRCSWLTIPGSAVAAELFVGDFFPAIINGDLFYLSGMLIRRECVVQAGPFNERLRYFNDWDFFSRLCLTGPGAYVGYDGFRRETGRADQISRARPITAMPRRHVFILHNLVRRSDINTRYQQQLKSALADARFAFARSLLRAGRLNWALRYLRHCLRHHHKPVRCAALFILGALRGSRA